MYSALAMLLGEIMEVILRWPIRLRYCDVYCTTSRWWCSHPSVSWPALLIVSSDFIATAIVPVRALLMYPLMV